MDRIVVQRALTTTLTFEFRKNSLSYTLKDLSGELQISPNYESILVQQPYSLRVKDRPLMKVAIALLVAPFMVVLLRNALAAPAILLGLVVSVPLLAISSRGVRCTMLKMDPTPPGAGQLDIRIMRDRNHDEIFNEISTRWRERLRFLHLAVNHANIPEREKAKFKWLHDNEVISDREFEAVMKQIRSEPSMSSETTPVLN